MNIIPLPKNAVEKDKNIKLGKDTVVEGEFPETSAKVVDFVSQFDGGENVKIRFSCDVKIPKEGYVIICERNTVNVSASSEAGAFYAFATLRQRRIASGRRSGFAEIRFQRLYARLRETFLERR